MVISIVTMFVYSDITEEMVTKSCQKSVMNQWSRIDVKRSNSCEVLCILWDERIALDQKLKRHPQRMDPLWWFGIHFIHHQKSRCSSHSPKIGTNLLQDSPTIVISKDLKKVTKPNNLFINMSYYISLATIAREFQTWLSTPCVHLISYIPCHHLFHMHLSLWSIAPTLRQQARWLI